MLKWFPLSASAALLLLTLSGAATEGGEKVVWQGEGSFKLVEVLADSAPPDTTPPDPPDPPGDPAKCYSGYVPLVGWWLGYCGDELRNFQSGTDYGAMRTNAEALRWLDGSTPISKGFIEVDIYFATDRVPQGTGGLHVLSPASGHKALGTPIQNGGYPGWLRPDFQTRGIDGTTAELRVGTYNADGEGRRWFQRRPGDYDIVVDVWSTGIILQPQVWIPLRFEWFRAGEWIVYSLNGRARTVRIHADSHDIAAFAVGNMDGLSLFGGTPEVRYRNFRWGRL
jgi:hypothetical protein